MSNQALSERPKSDLSHIENVLINGDLSKLSSDQRLNYYNTVCTSLGLNPLTKPFEYITLNGKLTLYARKDATEQLRKIHNVSITGITKEVIEGVYVVVAHAALPSGRTDTSTGAVTISNLKGESLANAFMKCETKAKRRVTLSICGLGMLDETEVETIAQPKDIGHQNAEAGSTEKKTIIAPVTPLPPATHGPSSAQLSRLFAIAKSAGITSKELLKQWIAQKFNVNPNFSLKDLTPEEYNQICFDLELSSKEEAQDANEDFVPDAAPAPQASQPQPEQPINWFKDRNPDGSPKVAPSRESLNKRIMSIYKPFIMRQSHPGNGNLFSFADLLKSKYGVNEIILMTVEQLQHLADFMENSLNAQVK